MMTVLNRSYKGSLMICQLYVTILQTGEGGVGYLGVHAVSWFLSYRAGRCGENGG